MSFRVTGSGKTFTVTNVIKKYNTPTLVVCNKTLAVTRKFKSSFQITLSIFCFYDYYQRKPIYQQPILILKRIYQLRRNEKFRISATSALLSGRKDVIVVCSVSCIYGREINFFKEKSIHISEIF